jgi:ABC-type uncharacterized transport system involved in gliding motility auxiliary subunit
LPTTTALEIIETAPQQPQQPGMPPPSQQAEPLLETSAQASLVQAGASEGEDGGMQPRGPFTLAAVIDAGKQQQPGPMGMPPEENENAPRIVVIGDADMMTDLLISRGLVGNARLVLNSINWLVENEKLISIPPREDTPRYMTMNASQKRLVWALTMGIIPLGIGIVGFIVWWRRR